MEVVGRHDELRVIAAWLDGTAEDVLLIEGEAGIGKTTIWREALDEAARRGYTLLSSRAVPTEAQLSLAALRDLLDAGFDEVADDLPDPQRHALAVTLLREAPRGEPPDRGAVGVSVLSALRALAARGPTLIASTTFSGWTMPRAVLFGMHFVASRRARCASSSPGERAVRPRTSTSSTTTACASSG